MTYLVVVVSRRASVGCWTDNEHGRLLRWNRIKIHDSINMFLYVYVLLDMIVFVTTVRYYTPKHIYKCSEEPLLTMAWRLILFQMKGFCSTKWGESSCTARGRFMHYDTCTGVAIYKERFLPVNHDLKGELHFKFSSFGTSTESRNSCYVHAV